MKKILALLAAILFAQPALASTVVLNVTVPGSGTPFNFGSDGTNDWPLVQLWDGTTKMSVVQLGPAIPSLSIPTVLTPTQVTTDLCTLLRKTNIPISTTAAATQLVAPIALNQVYICGGMIISTASDTVNLIGGLGSTCATGSPLAIAGSITPSGGMDLAANVGFSVGNGGATIMSTTISGHGVCLTQTGTTKLSGFLSVVQSQL